MAAPLGNQFWRLAPTNGRKPLWEDPDDLKQAVEEYFDSVVSNPLFETQVIAFKGDGYDHPIDKMRTMSIQGLCVFLGIARQTWNNYKTKEEFLAVCEWAEMVMFDYKLSGAAAGLLNPSIIQRDLGLVDRKDHDVKSGGVPIKNNWHIHPVTTNASGK
jgi:hypothetical protein